MFDIVAWPRNQWSVWDELDSLQNDMNRLFGGQVAGSGGSRRRWRRSPAFPPVNIWHSEDGIIVDAELPGVELKDIDISVVKDRSLPPVGRLALQRRRRKDSIPAYSISFSLRASACRAVTPSLLCCLR